ncbi:PemI family protein [Enterococcus sp. DIV1375a]
MYILYFFICYNMYKQGEVVKMAMLSIKKWGNSNGLRLPKSVMEYLQIHTEDKVKITQEESNGKKRLIIEAVDSDNDLTIEQLFENYTEDKVHVTIQDLGNAVGNEKW